MFERAEGRGSLWKAEVQQREIGSDERGQFRGNEMALVDRC